jgi:hypothetical protein
MAPFLPDARNRVMNETYESRGGMFIPIIRRGLAVEKLPSVR